MADLIQTVDDEDDVDGGQEEEDGLELSDKAAFTFKDLMSDDEVEEQKPASTAWNFESHSAEAESAPAKDLADFLAERIKERLDRKREAEAEAAAAEAAAAAAGTADAEGADGGEASTGKRKKRKKAAAAAPEAAEEPAEAPEQDSAAAEAAGQDSQPAASSSDKGTVGHLRTDTQWAELRLSRPLLRAVADLRFDTPTPIQRDVIPPALAGQDILATAETGSGKTASFLLPILERLCQSPNVRCRKFDASGRMMIGRVATKAMILIPSRELAVQCHSMLQNLSKYTMVTYQLVAGGFAQKEQASSLRHQPDIVVATPGRLLDHLLNSQSVHMELLEVVVFDEADRLLELGFRQECMTVLQHCAKGRQTMLFSATLNASVGDLAELALVKPVRVHVNKVNRVAEMLEQEFVKAPKEELREAVLLSLVTRNYTRRVIVFCATKKATHRVAILLGLSGLSFTEISGNLLQVDRVKALQRFQSGEADFLVATDLAARGLDLQNVDTVINFHLPLDIARYVHRVGRTARAGRSGRAVTIYTPEEYLKVKKLGKQCCTQVKAKVFKRSIAADAMVEWADKISALEADIEEIIQEEGIERESRYANMLVDKTENITKNKESIHSRPAKTWFMSGVDKRKLKQDETSKIKAIEAEGLAEEGEVFEEVKPAPKPVLTEMEQREERYRQRVREKYFKKIADGKADNAKEQAAARRLVRGSKNKLKESRMSKEADSGLYDKKEKGGSGRGGFKAKKNKKKGGKGGGGKGGGKGGGSKPKKGSKKGPKPGKKGRR
mmetsp:Transcript_30057/g.70054  ORF Transcript_30057/g.70054 Transcript_30057/m.70054 type:complete len:784 (-) Transcript_30057:14-2365(-)